jgi:hypothetical protein
VARPASTRTASKTSKAPKAEPAVTVHRPIDSAPIRRFNRPTPPGRPFEVVSDFSPAGDQPKAIAELSEGLLAGEPCQTLLGITGSGKSATIAWTIEQVQRPTLVIAPNKSLAAQLANELKEFFPKNRVEYFVSYYDYYQPEAYMPSSDTYIEKDSSVNDEIDRLRHSATAALLTRRDTIVVASVSCIYGLGSPEEYQSQLLVARVGEAKTSGPSCASSSTCNTSAMTPTWCGASSGCGATPSSCIPRTTSTRCASRCSATRSSRS